MALDRKRQIVGGDPATVVDDRISRRPPSAMPILIWLAPLSREFSSNSLTIDAGRSMTSPAAIFPMVRSVRTRIGMDMMLARAESSPRNPMRARQGSDSGS